MAFGALPWESGPLAFILGESADPISVPQFDVLNDDRIPLPPLPEAASPPAAAGKPAPDGKTTVLANAVINPKGRRREGHKPVAQDTCKEQQAVDKWQLVLVAAGAHSSLGKLAKGDAHVLRKAIEQSLELKSPATSSKRAGALLLYLHWATETGVPAFPVDEDVCNKYLEVAVAASPTRASSFLEALAFAYGMFKLCDLDEILTPRNKGLAARGMKRKRKRVQRIPISAAGVQLCEAEVAAGLRHSPLTEQEYIILGLLLFRVHARLRCGDAVRISKEPVIDGDFFETELEPGQHKTGHAKAFRDLSLPVAGFARGVLDIPWCEMWLAARAQLGLDAAEDGTLMPAAYGDGSFGAGRMSTSELGHWEKSILFKMGLAEASSEQFGTHSAKATLLSWAAKADLAPHDRRLLGARVDREEKSMITYARDAMAGP